MRVMVIVKASKESEAGGIAGYGASYSDGGIQ